MNNGIVRRPVSHIDARIGLLSAAISSQEYFAYAATRPALLLMRKIDLRYCHVHKITGRLHSLDSEIAQSFVDAHRTLTFRSTALYLQGVFFNTNTAVVQMPEAMVLVLMVLAKHQDVRQRLRQGSEETYLNRVLTEQCRYILSLALRTASRRRILSWKTA